MCGIENQSYKHFPVTTAPLITIVALSGLAMGLRRQMCRETWMRDICNYPTVDAVFAIGAQGTVVSSWRFDDELFLPTPDDYFKLPMRTQAAARWLIDNTAAEVMFKCDDDTYICLPRLIEAIVKWRSLGFDCIGRVYHRTSCMSGCGYMLSRKAVEIVANTDFQAIHRAEDVAVTKTMHHHGIPVGTTCRFSWRPKDGYPRADNDMISCTYDNPQWFQERHADLKAAGAI